MMIKKLVLSLLVAATGLAVAIAGNYQYNCLNFLTTDGTVQTIAVDGLTMTMSDGTLTATNGTSTVSFPLSGLYKMYFSESSGLTQLAEAVDEAVDVFNEAGIHLGRWDNTVQALRELPAGVYVIKGSSLTIKIAVR